MSNIRQVHWNEGAPLYFIPGMIVSGSDGCPDIVGHGYSEEQEKSWRKAVTRWAWLIQPHELNWLEDMASRKTRTQE